MKDIGELARAVVNLETIVESELEPEDREKNRSTINKLLEMMDKLINIHSNEVQSQIDLNNAEIEKIKS